MRAQRPCTAKYGHRSACRAKQAGEMPIFGRFCSRAFDGDSPAYFAYPLISFY